MKLGENNNGLVLHDHALAFYADRRALGLGGVVWRCELQKRWSFFLTRAPLNVPAGIASPPNALAVF